MNLQLARNRRGAKVTIRCGLSCAPPSPSTSDRRTHLVYVANDHAARSHQPPTRGAARPQRLRRRQQHHAEQSLVFRVPVTPQKKGTPSATSLGPIGITTNGVVMERYADGRSCERGLEHGTHDGWYPDHAIRISRRAGVRSAQQMWTVNGTLRANCGGVYHATLALDRNQIQRDAHQLMTENQN